MVLPSANLHNLVVQSSEKETLIYNLSTHQAFCLNDTLTKVFDSCDGKTSFDELKRNYNFTDDLIYLALDELESKNLLEDYQGNRFDNLSRREVIKRVGLATMFALPIIVGISAPLAAQAQSVDVCLTNNCSNGIHFAIRVGDAALLLPTLSAVSHLIPVLAQMRLFAPETAEEFAHK
jgi:hypothetical protein